jgi:hypothetical protein
MFKSDDPSISSMLSCHCTSIERAAITSFVVVICHEREGLAQQSSDMAGTRCLLNDLPGCPGNHVAALTLTPPSEEGNDARKDQAHE